MFTGIVQGVAQLASIFDEEGVRTFVVKFSRGFTAGLKIGSSVSVDGVCLTVTRYASDCEVEFDVMHQSLLVTTLRDCLIGQAVNVERAAKEGAEIGGHPLSGHIDFAAEIQNVATFGNNKVLRIALPEQFAPYVFSKGYIALNGASLTVSDCDKVAGWFEVWLIPETRRATVLDAKVSGDWLNVEIERVTQVVVDTVRASVRESMGELRPLLESLLHERGIVLEELISAPIRTTHGLPRPY